MNLLAVKKNRTAYLSGDYPRELLDKLASYTVPGAWYMPAYHRRKMVHKVINGQRRLVSERVWDGRTHLLKHHALPAGLLRALEPELEKAGHRVRWVDKEEYWVEATRKTDPSDRPYQTEAVDAMLSGIRLGGLVVAATGVGKTHLAGRFFSCLKDGFHLFVVDELTLLHQAKKELSEVTGEEVGMVGEGSFEPGRITVATIQTLWLHFKEEDTVFSSWFSQVKTVIVDEVHIQMNRRNFSVLDRLQPEAVYGLTATLELRKKDVRTRAYALCGPVLYEYPLESGINEGYLSPLHVAMVRYGNPDSLANYRLAYTDRIVDNLGRNRLAAEIAEAALESGHRVILLVDRVRHLKIMEKLLSAYRPEVIWGGRESAERLEAKNQFEAGAVRLIITNRVFEKGIDIRSVTVGIDLAGMKSRVKAIQKLGRLARRSGGKRYALYFDFYDEGEESRFERAARSRKRAYQRAGVPVLMVRGQNGGAIFRKIVETAEAQSKPETPSLFEPPAEVRKARFFREKSAKRASSMSEDLV